MVAQGADVCTYVFVCVDVSGIPSAIASTSHWQRTDTGEVSFVSLHLFCLVCVCVCVGWGQGSM